jgi:hydroxyacylglutathione hydrolase
MHDGDQLKVGGLAAQIIFIPAHTSGHVAYHFPAEHAVFTGDTLFAAGCGRLFEGDAAQMMSSLGRLAALPDDTRVFAATSYAEEPRVRRVARARQQAATKKLDDVRALRKAGNRRSRARSPGKATNPFLRTASAELAATVRGKVPGIPANDPVALFAAVRALKDRF